MTDHEKLVMRNIIYAVETGGQVYGQKDYADFTEAYTNSSAEHAITIGAGQWYGNEARTLLLKIKTTDAATFSKYDTAGVAADLNKTDWSNYQLSKTSAGNCTYYQFNSWSSLPGSAYGWTDGNLCEGSSFSGRYSNGCQNDVCKFSPSGWTFCGEKDSCQDYKALHTGSSLYCLPDRYRKSGRSI